METTGPSLRSSSKSQSHRSCWHSPQEKHWLTKKSSQLNLTFNNAYSISNDLGAFDIGRVYMSPSKSFHTPSLWRSSSVGLKLFHPHHQSNSTISMAPGATAFSAQPSLCQRMPRRDRRRRRFVSSHQINLEKIEEREGCIYLIWFWNLLEPREVKCIVDNWEMVPNSRSLGLDKMREDLYLKSVWISL